MRESGQVSLKFRSKKIKKTLLPSLILMSKNKEDQVLHVGQVPTSNGIDNKVFVMLGLLITLFCSEQSCLPR